MHAPWAKEAPVHDYQTEDWQLADTMATLS